MATQIIPSRIEPNERVFRMEDKHIIVDVLEPHNPGFSESLAKVHCDVRHFAIGIVRHIHLNPASHLSQIFIKAGSNINDSRL